MTEKNSPLPWEKWSGGVVASRGKQLFVGTNANAALIVRSVNGLPEAIAALEDLQQKAGVVATWLNHWDVPFAAEDEWRGPTGDGQLFFNALNKAAAALTKLKG
ncbi:MULTISPECIES: hypothetical protein [unclassified Bradyrhizobium]|uniref:hypothetical protein n=1 Tax=unclassified Bradyrhizobium TaxID=2631580 RepID=UPI0028E20078|nr:MULTISPECIES: hypothetical protein [unclassified Bradyrhizobium]